MRAKVLRIFAIIVVPAAALMIWAVAHWTNPHVLTVKAYFSNVAGLREGAKVRIAGVDMGTVRSVRVRPELGQEPVEVVMQLNPSYEIRIPSDSAVSLQTAGVLGETYAAIDIATASGPPLGPNAVLKTRPTEQMNTEKFLDVVSKVLEKNKCDCGGQREKAAPAKRPAVPR
jgi:ABC-type transporter Mla subunit MlaD